MVSDFGYTTSSDVGDRLRTTFDTSTTPTATQVDAIISEQEAIINDYAGRRFDSYTVTQEKYDHDGSSVITLKQPAQSITTLRKTSDNGDSWDTVPSTDYIFDSDYNRIERKVGGASNTGSWPTVSGQHTVDVTYEAGYSSPPARIATLALDMSVLGVIRTLLDSQVNEEGGDIKVGPIEIGESKILQNPGYVRDLQSSIQRRLEGLRGSSVWTSVGKLWDR